MYPTDIESRTGLLDDVDPSEISIFPYLQTVMPTRSITRCVLSHFACLSVLQRKLKLKSKQMHSAYESAKVAYLCVDEC